MISCVHTCFVLYFSSLIITSRNEVLAKVIFLQVCVILFTGGVLSWGVPPNFWGGFLQNLGGFLQIFLGGSSSKFSGGFLQIFWGVLQILEGGGSSRIRSTFSWYASYWNAFLFKQKSDQKLSKNGYTTHS